MQDYSRGVGIDRLGAFGSAHVLRDHRALGARSGPAFIPQEHRKPKSLRTVAGKGAARLRTRAFAAVHVAWQTQDDTHNAALSDQRSQAVAITAPFAAAQSLARARKAPPCVTQGGADRLRAKVKAKQDATVWQRLGKINRTLGNQGAALGSEGMAVPAIESARRATSACVLAQNSGISYT